MKKNLRLLCLGLAAATVTCGFAQEDKTSLLKNADMEQGLKGWVVDGSQFLGKNTKNLSVQTGFYGMGQTVLEAWNGNGNGLADSYIMQRLSGLPSGTYVFGAYIGASKQYHRKDVCEIEKVGEQEKHVLVKDAHQYEYWSNRDSVQGVQLFANKEVVRVATNNPDYNNMVCADGSLYTDGHASKFNVAVTLTDADAKKGYLDAGLRYTNTNANYVVWDNATLYYFGDMSKEAALDAMAEIDMTNAAALIDTLKAYKMNVDSLANLTTVLDGVAAKTTTAATLWDDVNTLHYAAAKARRSINDYKNLENNIKSANELLEVEEWTQPWAADIKALLEEIVATAEEAYTTAEMNREELTALRKELNWTAGDLHVDSVFAAQTRLAEYVYAKQEQLNLAGGVSQSQLDVLNTLLGTIAVALGAYETDYELPMEERTINPNDLLRYIAAVEEAIAEVEANPYDPTAVWSKTLPQSVDAIAGYKPLAGTTAADDLYTYESPLLEFGAQTELVRLTVTKVASGSQIYFCIQSLEFFDAEGNEIELAASNFYSNADHNTVSGGTDGQSYEGLVDDNADTYFHSDWSGKITEPHYLEVTLPNGGYSAVSFKMVARAANQRHQFPGEIVVTTPVVRKNYTRLEKLVLEAEACEAYSAADPGFYTGDFSYLLKAIADAKALLATEDASEDACEEMRKTLQRQMQTFKDPATDKSIHLPNPEKEYRIISGYPGFYEKQFVEKALTVHAADTALWWENVCADSLQQVFKFEPILDADGEPSIEVETGDNADGTTWEKVYYHYTIKNVAYNLYLDSAFVGEPLNVHLAKEATDTITLLSLGRGQWNIMMKNGTLHCGDHNSGSVGGPNGAYGGTWGVSSSIVPYGGGIDGCSAWFIREFVKLPATVEVAAGQFKSQFFHFQAANTMTLVADKDCQFTDLALYDLYGNALEIADVTVVGNTATITTENNIAGCAFAFTNNEGVASVKFDAKESQLGLLQDALDEAVSVAPVEGTEVMQYADLSEYNGAIEKAEAMLANGGTDDEIKAMIAELEAAVANLTPNMPVAGKYYIIYNSVTAFEERNGGLKMTLFSEGVQNLRWGIQNELEWTRYWQFEQATAEELKAAGMSEDATAFYIKNVATESYIGEVTVADGNSSSLTTKASALPVVLTSLGGNGGVEVALDILGQSGKRIHANNHGGGAGKGSNIVYWSSGVGTASSWTIVETQYDVTDIDFTEVETEKAVVKGIYDIFGRRVVAPIAPGLYIIDGKKRYIK